MQHQNPPYPPPPPQWNQPYQQGPGGYQPFNQGGFGMQTDVPGASTAQTCGIIGIILFFNIIGIILNIVAISNGNRAMREFQMFPGRYTEASFRRAKAGRTCGIVGLSLLGGGLLILFLCVLAFS